jgi:hypothetical protein
VRIHAQIVYFKQRSKGRDITDEIYKIMLISTKRRKGIGPADKIYPPNERLELKMKDLPLDETGRTEKDGHPSSMKNDFEAALAELPQRSQTMPHEVVNSTQGEATLPDFVVWDSEQFSAGQLKRLSANDAMSLPESRILDSLLESYINSVHPQMPFLDVSRFLFAISSDGQCSQISLLLLHAVLFAGALYIDIDTDAGIPRDLKQSLRSRAKVCNIRIALLTIS